MKESLDNIYYICADCSSKRSAEWQKSNKNTVIIVGHHCKLEFREGKRVEHMWVRVTKVNSNNVDFAGILDNDPVLILNIQCGDKVKFNHKQIEDYL